MNVAIAGAGIAGTYLARLLQEKGINPDLFDGMEHETTCRCRSCGWGAPVGIGNYLAKAGLLFDDYLMTPMVSMNFVGLVSKTPLCTINKPRLLRDLASGLPLQKQSLGIKDADAYDIIVDATGISRAFLPPCRSDLVLPTVQHRVFVESLCGEPLEAGVYGNRIPGLGYLWIFPLGQGQYHIGVGGIRLDQHESIMEQFYEEHAPRFTFTPICSCRGIIRVASPYYSAPLYASRTRENGTPQRIIGVGEAIGTVSPFTGEGIIYSLECARLLADSFPDEKRYASKVLARFGWMKRERETLDYLLSKGRATGPRLRDRWRFFRNAQRSGIDLPMIEAFRRMGSLSRWVENP
ncbi:MAG: NAD(P)/FAD-dependent oxidoreductase [Methanoregulaceae archaeon]|nr:NAD(P)/FAD-dependent oxidoreductase [Methanoregulaceae archaeon]